MNKLLTFSLAAVLAVSLMAGCTPKDDANPGIGSAPNEGQSSQAASSAESSSSGGDVSGAAESGKLSDIHEAVKGVFGESYIPSMSIDATMLEEQFGIEQNLIKEVIAEGPMISMHVDMFIGIEAADAEKADLIEKALTSYRDSIAKDTMQYPMNMAKVQAARVERIDNYVFFLLLGETTDEALDMSEEDQLKYYQAENQKAVDAIREVLGK